MILMLVRECLFEHVFLKCQISSNRTAVGKRNSYACTRINPALLDRRPYAALVAHCPESLKLSELPCRKGAKKILAASQDVSGCCDPARLHGRVGLSLALDRKS